MNARAQNAIRFLIAAFALAIMLFRNIPAKAVDIPTRDRIFDIQLQTNQQGYKVGEPILVSVATENDTSDEYMMQALPACLAVSLKVSDRTGVDGYGRRNHKMLSRFHTAHVPRSNVVTTRVQ